MLKICTECKWPKSFTEFHIRQQSPDGHSVYCKECACNRTKKWASKNPVKVKENAVAAYKRNHLRQKANNRFNRYGVTPERYKEMLQSQNGMCAICSSIEPGGRGDWHVDHCHKTNKVRSLLCHLCNTGLGSFQDSRELLLSASKYLQQYGD